MARERMIITHGKEAKISQHGGEFLAVPRANPGRVSAVARAILPHQILAKAIFKARAAPEPFAWPFPYESVGPAGNLYPWMTRRAGEEEVGRKAKRGSQTLCDKGGLLCFHSYLITCHPGGAGCQGWASVPNHTGLSTGLAIRVLAASTWSLPCQLLRTGSGHFIDWKTTKLSLDSFWPR